MSSAAYFNQNATMLNSHLKKKKKKGPRNPHFSRVPFANFFPKILCRVKEEYCFVF